CPKAGHRGALLSEWRPRSLRSVRQGSRRSRPRPSRGPRALAEGRTSATTARARTRTSHPTAPCRRRAPRATVPTSPTMRMVPMEELKPKNHQEAVAVFRHGVIGALTQAELELGQLRAALEELAKKRFVPPKSKTARTFSVPTLERWYYAFK